MGQSHICTIMSYFPYSNVLTLGDLLTLRRPPPAKFRPMASSSPASALFQYKPLSPEPTPGHLFNWPHTQPLSTSPGYPILSDSPTTQSQLKSFKLAGPTLPTPPHSLPGKHGTGSRLRLPALGPPWHHLLETVTNYLFHGGRLLICWSPQTQTFCQLALF